MASKYTFFFLATGVLFAIANCSGPAKVQHADIVQGEKVYKYYCAGCHGQQLQGGAATALTKKILTYGNDRNSILKAIRTGIPSTLMIKYDKLLTEKEINSVTDYVLAVRKDPGIAATEIKLFETTTKDYKLKIERVITQGIKTPWGVEFVNATTAFITGRSGDLYIVQNGKLDTNKIIGLPMTYGYDLFGGMLDLALDPDYKNNGWIYLAFSHNARNSTDPSARGMTKIVRGKLKDHKWVEEQSLFEVDDSIRVVGSTRWGCRLLFDKAGYLYFTIGDMQHSVQFGNNPQLLNRAEGKIFRINKDGSIPVDNPFYGKNNVLQAIYAIGTRNVQGLAQDPETGKIYFSDHGPQGGDELNLLKKRGNYGWPVITYGVNYDGTTITIDTAKEGMEQPLTYWRPSIATCAVEFVNNSLFPKWNGNLLLTALKNEELRRLVIENDKIIEQEILIKGYGRVRDAKFAPDGSLYILTNDPDALLRITPLEDGVRK
jgi:aldose sugar dehydrogenase